MTYEIVDIDNPIIIHDKKVLASFIDDYAGELIVRYNKKIYKRINKKTIELVAVYEA